MSDVELLPTEELIAELKRRNLSFLIAYCDHQQFHKNLPDEGIVWGCDSGGNLVLQKVLLGFLTNWFTQVETSRCEPGAA